MTLLESTLKLFHAAREKKISLRAIAPEGGPVEYEWLRKWAQGDVEHPSVNRIQALHDRLVKMDLEAA